MFRYIGKISYGTYLWHVPIFLLLDATRLHLYGLPLLAVRIGVTLVVATASFYLVEQPIRRGRMRSVTEWKAWLMTSTAFLGVVAVTVAATVPTAGSAGAAGIPKPTGSQYTGPPVGVTMFGDSLAFTAGWALATNNAQDPLRRRLPQRGPPRLRGHDRVRPDHRGSGVPGQRAVQRLHPGVAAVAGAVARSASMPSIPTWSWCWPAAGRSPTR